MVGLDAPLRRVVGDKTARALVGALDLHTVEDLLRHYPRRYAERGQLTDLADLRAGEHVTVLAEVAKVHGRRMKTRPGKIVEAVVGDGRRSLLLTYFNQPWREKELRPGRRALFAGEVRKFNRSWQLTHPDYLLLDDETDGLGSADFMSALIPVYPATTKLSSWQIAKAVRVVLDVLDDPDDPLPWAIRRRRRLPELGVALRGVHRPADRAELDRCLERLKWDEALTLQLTLAQRRAAARAVPTTARRARGGGLLAAFDERLPFPLTAGQRAVGAAIAADLARPYPMHRLLQGEVGSGKTLVALRAMLTVVDAGGQAVLLAPTEVLATQHARSLRDLLGSLATAGELGADEHATRLALLTGSTSTATRRAVLGELARGSIGIVVGTHALLEPDVTFADLGLVVVDEQHRFGVEQRDALRRRAGMPPHVLVMTATPIPRTVAMTVYGDLETSTLRELPPGRLPVTTHVVPTGNGLFFRRTWARLTEEVRSGRQAFVVCPRIGLTPGEDDADSDPDAPDPAADHGGRSGDDAAQARRPPLAVLDVLPLLTKEWLPDVRVGVLHGQLPSEEKDAVMLAFVAGDLDVLLATTVIEVGVDVPNATVLAVLDADRFGVSQLHQLRGRVGRGRAPGLCLLLTEAAPGTPARERLAAVAATTDGFALARLDLEHRREGDVLGAAQSGRRSQLRLLRLLADEDLILAARDEATSLVDDDPGLTSHPALARAVVAAVDPDRAGYLEKA